MQAEDSNIREGLLDFGDLLIEARPWPIVMQFAQGITAFSIVCFALFACWRGVRWPRIRAIMSVGCVVTCLVGCRATSRDAENPKANDIYSISSASPGFRVVYGTANNPCDAVLQLWPDGNIYSAMFKVNDDMLEHMFAGWREPHELVIRLIVRDAGTTDAEIATAVRRIYSATKTAQNSNAIVLYVQSRALAKEIGVLGAPLQKNEVGYTAPTVEKAVGEKK